MSEAPRESGAAGGGDAGPDLWRDADFVRLGSAATIANFGSMVTQLALPFAPIQVLGAGAAELGMLRALVLVPGPGLLGFGLLVAQQLGAGGEVVYSVHASSLRPAVPREIQGRVSACFAFLAQAGMLAGTAAGAALGEAFGARATLAAGAAGILLAAGVVRKAR